MREIAIVGGGAAGLAAAVRAGSVARDLGLDARICVYESAEKVGRSILRSGNGRCNFTNANITADTVQDLYHNGAFAVQTMEALTKLNAAVEGARTKKRRVHENPQMNEDDQLAMGGTEDVLRMFGDLGLSWRVEDEGRMYPRTNKASTVLDALRFALERRDVQVECNATVTAIEVPGERGRRFALRMRDGSIRHADAVIVACGGSVAKGLLPLAWSEPEPMLGPLAVREKSVVRALDNIRVRCSVQLVRDGEVVAEEAGELLFRKYGVSGICVFNISRHAQPGDTLRVNLVPDVPNLYEWMYHRTNMLTKEYFCPTCADVLSGLVLPLVADALAKIGSFELSWPASQENQEIVADALQCFELTVDGVGDEAQCQVHRGGIAVDQVDPETLQVHDVPGLYVVGEALDVDAPCGGYNLHWAWASGLVAATNAVNAAAVGEELPERPSTFW